MSCFDNWKKKHEKGISFFLKMKSSVLSDKKICVDFKQFILAWLSRAIFIPYKI